MTDEHMPDEPRTVTPELLVPGDVILGARDGREWTVVEGRHDIATGTVVTLERDCKRQDVPTARLPQQVVLVVTAAEQHERAVALAQVRLGGEVVAVQDADGPHRTPFQYPDLPSLLGHLYLFHTDPQRDSRAPLPWPQGLTMATALEHHHDAHSRTLYVPHVHERGFYAALRSLDGAQPSA